MPLKPKARWFTVKTLLIAFIPALALVLTVLIAVKLQYARHQAPTPQMIFVLEGDTRRVEFAARFARTQPQLPIWISGNPGNEPLNRQIFQQAGIASTRVHYEFCASDTVTHFSCNAQDFARKQIQHIYLVTSDSHMPRAKAIATLIFGSEGIAFTPVVVPTDPLEPERLFRVLRDCVRSLVWIVTGRTGASLNPKI